METRPEAREVLAQLLEAALDREPLARLQEFVSVTPHLAAGSFMRGGREGWTQAAHKLSTAELAALIRLLTLAERAIPGWDAGSVSPAIWLFDQYARAEGTAAGALADWVLRNTSNPYLPYGSHNLGASSRDELKVLQGEAARIASARAAAESERQDQAEARRSAKATRNLFGAIRRGDFRAVHGLLDQGASLSARNDDSHTPLDYAVLLGRDAIAELIRESL